MVRRERTNTPLQALLLHERAAVRRGVAHPGRADAARGGAATGRRTGCGTCSALVTARTPDEVGTGRSPRHAWPTTSTRSRADPKGAEQLIRVGETRPDAALNPQELAAWTMVGNLVLNLDEVINR